jgi:hypothetical protein
VRAGLGGLGVSLIFWLAIGGPAGYGKALGLGQGLGLWLFGGLIVGLTFGLPTGLIIGLLFGLLSGLQAERYVTPPAPGKAVQRSKRNALVSGLPIGLGVGLGIWSVLAATFDPNAGLTVGLAVGLGVGLIAALQRGGGAYLRHHLLRWLLVRTRSIPRDYVAFLDYGTQLIPAPPPGRWLRVCPPPAARALRRSTVALVASACLPRQVARLTGGSELGSAAGGRGA